MYSHKFKKIIVLTFFLLINDIFSLFIVIYFIPKCHFYLQ